MSYKFLHSSCFFFPISIFYPSWKHTNLPKGKSFMHAGPGTYMIIVILCPCVRSGFSSCSWSIILCFARSIYMEVK